MELVKGRPMKEALDAAFGAMMGRFLGTVCKCGAGGAMLALTAHRIWPEPMAVPVSPDSLDGPAKLVLSVLHHFC